MCFDYKYKIFPVLIQFKLQFIKDLKKLNKFTWIINLTIIAIHVLIHVLVCFKQQHCLCIHITTALKTMYVLL